MTGKHDERTKTELEECAAMLDEKSRGLAAREAALVKREMENSTREAKTQEAIDRFRGALA